MAAVFAEDALTRDAGSDEVAAGRQAVRERAAGLFAAFPDLRLERESRSSSTGIVMPTRWVLTGTHEGTLLGLAPTGRSLRVQGATFTVMNSASSPRTPTTMDLTGFLTQLGVLG